MKKRHLLILVLCIIPYLGKGQAAYPTPEEVKSFYGTETLVVLENTMFSTFNAFIKASMKDFWTATSYRFISVDEFENLREDPAYSFIVLTETTFDRDKAGTDYSFLNLLLGKDVARLEQMPELCAIPLSFADDEDVEYGFKVGIVLRFLQTHVKHLDEDPSLTGKRYLKYYNKFIPDVQDKTILLSSGDLVEELQSEATVQDLYDHDIKIVDDEEIKNAILEKRANTLVLHMVGPEDARTGGICFKMLIGTDDGMIYFYGEHKITPKKARGLLVSDLKRIGRF